MSQYEQSVSGRTPDTRDAPAERFPAPSELVRAAAALVHRHPRLCTLRRVGLSRAGRPLHLLSVGHADAAVLVVAGAHANEPAGGPAVRRLAGRVAADPALRTRTSWHFLLCADPDGARLHQMRAPGSLLEYHRRFYRPRGAEQPEWSPSYVPPHRLPPETRALTGVLDELRPYLQVSLHGTDLGGSWVQVTRDIPGLAEPFAKSAAELRIPIEAGPSDAVGWPVSGPGVHVMPEPGADTPFPSVPEDVRHSTWHHIHRYGGRTAVIEVPLWASDRVTDLAPHPDPSAALRDSARRLREHTRAVTRVLATALPRLPGPPGPLTRSARWILDLSPALADDWERLPSEGATAAYVWGMEAFGRRLPLRAAGMLLRELTRHHSPSAAALGPLITRWSHDFTTRFTPRRVPLDSQTEHQTRTTLAAATHTPHP
ncbi:hydroxylacyl-CoA dehydrogenase [Streptomyces rutgersensis]|uniref:M14 family zinc carboxypeptidase n=1 Tax=Streptomyces rutgersensis TaxID=53451 RepID=UPI0013C5BB9B|nr:M14 family zinc carboxypeptidase [Streptomyces rutgersensis]GFH68347.1 hydroxylacyl-CoA dehydrogenase [Streptomyces rutgersensis]